MNTRQNTLPIIAIALSVRAVLKASAQPEADGIALFETRMRPLPVEHCYERHSAEAGIVFFAGHPELTNFSIGEMASPREEAPHSQRAPRTRRECFRKVNRNVQQPMAEQRALLEAFVKSTSGTLSHPKPCPSA